MIKKIIIKKEKKIERARVYFPQNCTICGPPCCRLQRTRTNRCSTLRRVLSMIRVRLCTNVNNTNDTIRYDVIWLIIIRAWIRRKRNGNGRSGVCKRGKITRRRAGLARLEHSVVNYNRPVDRLFDKLLLEKYGLRKWARVSVGPYNII